MSRSFSTTSSVFAISRFCSVWIFWIISYVDGSDPSSLRPRSGSHDTFLTLSSLSTDAPFAAAAVPETEMAWGAREGGCGE